MAFQFPNNPATGSQITNTGSGIVYTYDGNAWSTTPVTASNANTASFTNKPIWSSFTNNNGQTINTAGVTTYAGSTRLNLTGTGYTIASLNSGLFTTTTNTLTCNQAGYYRISTNFNGQDAGGTATLFRGWIGVNNVGIIYRDLAVTTNFIYNLGFDVITYVGAGQVIDIKGATGTNEAFNMYGVSLDVEWLWA